MGFFFVTAYIELFSQMTWRQLSLYFRCQCQFVTVSAGCWISGSVETRYMFVPFRISLKFFKTFLTNCHFATVSRWEHYHWLKRRGSGTNCRAAISSTFRRTNSFSRPIYVRCKRKILIIGGRRWLFFTDSLPRHEVQLCRRFFVAFLTFVVLGPIFPDPSQTNNDDIALVPPPPSPN